jgi:hypothetical protein
LALGFTPYPSTAGCKFSTGVNIIKLVFFVANGAANKLERLPEDKFFSGWFKTGKLLTLPPYINITWRELEGQTLYLLQHSSFL